MGSIIIINYAACISCTFLSIQSVHLAAVGFLTRTFQENNPIQLTKI